MGWANNSIDRCLRGAELTNKRLALLDNGKVIYLEEASIQWLEDAIERILYGNLYVPKNKKSWCIEEIHNELNKRKKLSKPK